VGADEAKVKTLLFEGSITLPTKIPTDDDLYFSGNYSSARSITSTGKFQLFDLNRKLYRKRADGSTMFQNFCKLHAAGGLVR
jgi:hypothetical protein